MVVKLASHGCQTTQAFLRINCAMKRTEGKTIWKKGQVFLQGQSVEETAKHTSAVPTIGSHHVYHHASYAEAVKANV